MTFTILARHGESSSLRKNTAEYVRKNTSIWTKSRGTSTEQLPKCTFPWRSRLPIPFSLLYSCDWKQWFWHLNCSTDTKVSWLDVEIRNVPFPRAHLEEHRAVCFCIGRLHVIWRAGVSAAWVAHDDAFTRLPLKASCQAAATCSELLRLLEPRILQDALGKRSSAAQALSWSEYSKFTFQSHLTLINITQFTWINLKPPPAPAVSSTPTPSVSSPRSAREGGTLSPSPPIRNSTGVVSVDPRCPLSRRRRFCSTSCWWNLSMQSSMRVGGAFLCITVTWSLTLKVSEASSHDLIICQVWWGEGGVLPFHSKALQISGSCRRHHQLPVWVWHLPLGQIWTLGEFC